MTEKTTYQLPPQPSWPTAPHVWWDGEVWTLDDDGEYLGPGDFWEVRHMRNGLTPDIRDRARRFAREAVPVTIVPAAEWVILRRCVKNEEPVWDAAEALVDATDELNRETNG